MAPDDKRLTASDSDRGRGGRAEAADPHWVWVPTSVLIASEAYWAQRRAEYVNAPRLMQDPQTGRVYRAEPTEDEKFERERAWANEQDEAQQRSRYVAWVAHQHMIAAQDQYALEILHVDGVQEMVQSQIWQRQQHIAEGAAETMRKAIRSRIAAMVSKDVLEALEEVAVDASA